MPSDAPQLTFPGLPIFEAISADETAPCAPLVSAALRGLTRAIATNPSTFRELGWPDRIAFCLGISPDARAVKVLSHGKYRSHATLTMLARLGVSAENHEVDRLVAHYVLALASHDGGTSEELHSATYSASLALRKLMDQSNGDLLVQRLGTSVGDLHDHWKRLADWRKLDESQAPEFGPQSTLRRTVEDIERFHAFLGAIRKPQPGREHGKRRESTLPSDGVPAVESVDVPAPVIEPARAAVRVVTEPTTPTGLTAVGSKRGACTKEPVVAPRPRVATAVVSEERATEAKLRGEPSAEGVTRFEAIPNDNGNVVCDEIRPGRPRQRLPAGHYEIRARRAQAQEIRLADPATLRPPDLELLLTEVTNPAFGGGLKAAIAGALFGGQSPEAMLQWRVAEDIDRLNWATLTSAVLLEPFGLVVGLKAMEDLPGPGAGVVNTLAPAVFLPWHEQWRGLRLLKRYASARVGGPLYDAETIDAATSHLAGLRRDRTTALSLARLAKLLPEAILDLTEDVVDQALITGGKLDAHEQARLHYRQTSVHEIAATYCTAANRINRVLAPGSADQNCIPPPFAGVIGSQRCPDLQDVAVWVSELRERAGSPPRGRPTLAKVRTFHAVYSAYAAQFILWSCGARPHKKGLAALEPVNGLLLLDEKEKGVPAIRQVPLPKEALAQWNHYAAHRRWVMCFLGLKDSPLFFTITERGRACAMSPAKLHEIGGSPFEDNAHRHAYCTGLRRAGVLGAEVNRLMGHAGLGDEPGNRFAAAENGGPQAKLRAILSEHLTAHGWKAIEGFGHG